MNVTSALRRASLVVLVAAVVQVGSASAAVAAPAAPNLVTGLLQALTQPRPAAAPAAPAPAPPPLTMTQIEQKLASLHYDVGPVDGTYDDQTASAVLAFQKVYGLDRTGNLTDAVTAQIMATQADPPPLVPGDTSANKVEIDLRRQVLFLYEGGTLSRILPVSSGTSKTPTPTGDFRIYHQSQGWETSPLGRLYNSQYFVGGYAIHGALSVPSEPASHGCVRIPMTAADWFPQHVAIGTPVHILPG